MLLRAKKLIKNETEYLFNRSEDLARSNLEFQS